MPLLCVVALNMFVFAMLLASTIFYATSIPVRKFVFKHSTGISKEDLQTLSGERFVIIDIKWSPYIIGWILPYKPSRTVFTVFAPIEFWTSTVIYTVQ